MNLEYQILKFLLDNNSDKTIDVAFINDDYDGIKECVKDLIGKNLIFIDKTNTRDLENYGISSNRHNRIMAKINTNGKVYLHTLIKAEENITKKSKRKYKLSYFFNL